MDRVPGDFYHRMQAYARAWHTIWFPPMTISLLSIAVMIFCFMREKFQARGL
jgi:hypothetical protein